MNVYLPNLRLPSEYQEVEYIQSSGTQYINTGVTVNSANRVFKLKYEINTSNNNRSVFGTLVRGTEAGPNTRFSRLDNQLEWDCYAGNGYGRITYNKAIPSGAEEYELGNNYIKDLSTGTTLVTGTASNKSRSDYIPIFGRYQSDGSYVLSSLKLYYFQIIDNGTAIRDFVPCYRKSDSVIGLYDLVNNQFYTNAGTGTFSKGNDVTMTMLKNAYIGEYVPPYLCFTANTASSTVKLNKTGSPTAVTLETSTDLKNWTTYTIGTTITLANIGDKVYWRNTSTTTTGFNIDGSNRYQFVMTGSITGSGDINYLLNKNSTTTVSSYCYYQLFRSCTSLTTSPSLPATTLATNCYQNMFYGCTGLTTLTSLPATTLANNCYQLMFSACNKIKLSTTQTGEYQTAYRIPVTGTGTAGSNSLSNMFTTTGGTFTGTPTINTTYYTSNTIV